MQLDCFVDPGFKRTNKRDKFNELEDNVQRLQSLVERQQASEQNGSSVKSVSSNLVDDTTSYSSPALGHQPSPANHHPAAEDKVSRPASQIMPSSTSGSRSLGDVTVTIPEVEQLFGIFFEKYNPILPILDAAKTHTDYYEESKMLFWTILSIAMRTHLQYSAHYTKLTPILTNYVWSGIGHVAKLSTADVAEVQTLLLHATWPLPNLRLWSDRSMTMSSMALTSSMHMGLHRPGFDAEYAREPIKLDNKLITARSSAWVAAYCSCVTVAIENGHEALVPSKDWLINNVVSQSPTIYVPQELRHYAIIEKHANDAFRFFTSMSDNPAAVAHEPSFFAHVALFEKTLSEMSAMYSADMSLANKIRSQGTVLLIQSMYFLADQTLEQSKQGALRAYTTAVNLLTTLISDDNTNDFLIHAPNVFLRIIVRAAFVIMRTLFSSHGTNLDLANGKNLYDTAVFFIRQMSVKLKEKDQPLRVAEALKVMWKHMEGQPAFRKQPPIVKIQSRLGATLLYDCLIYYRRAALDAQSNRLSPAQSNPAQGDTPVSMDPVSEPAGGTSVNLTIAENWATPSFETFLESDLSWMDSLIDPGQLNVV